MTVPAVLVASESQVRRLAQDWLRKAPPGQVLAIQARPEWTAPERLEIDGHSVRVAACPSPLAMRAALVDCSPDERLIVLTDCDEDALGIGLLAHCAKLRPVSIDPWDLLRAQFGVAGLDPALARQGHWVAEALLEHAPGQGWPPVTAAVLTRDHAMRSLAAALLGVAPGDLDSAGILQWTTRGVDVVRYAALPARLRTGIAEWLGETAGATGRWAMACVDAGNGTDVIPLGLLAPLLWSEDKAVSPAVTAARVRVEHLLGGAQPSSSDAAAWGDAAHAWVERVADAGDSELAQVRNRVLHRAEEIAAAVQAEFLLVRSDVLPAALTARLHEFADRLRAAVVRSRAPSQAVVAGSWARELATAEASLKVVKQHRLAEEDRSVKLAGMAARLLRWLAIPEPPAPVTLAHAVARYVADDGWADRAQLAVWAGSHDPHLGSAYRELLTEIDQRRHATHQRFATLLAQVTVADSAPGGMLRVEDILARVVRPLVDSGQRILLLVVDGMGVAASTELVESVTRQDWIELTPGGGPRVGVLAALPTVTQVSRASLFAGQIVVGQQPEERKTLAAALGTSARLLHKADLRAGAGTSLDPSVITALEDPAIQVVAAVVNTIDDALERSTPDTTSWTTETVRAVENLLAHARDRVVVMLSDHGHVVDRGPDSQLRSHPDGGARWRTADSPPGDGELEFAGPRVGLGGGRVVLPWRDTLRYAPRKAGYHGGASPAEAVIPLTLLSASSETVMPGWAGAPVPTPVWWRGPLPSAAVTSVRATPDALFEVVGTTPVAPAAAGSAVESGPPPLVSALLASGTYRRRRKLVSRGVLSEDRVVGLLSALVRAGGRARFESLAADAGVPAHRIQLAVTALRRLLQVEGYPVLDLDPDGQTVVLDEKLLTEQFQLESSSSD